MTIQPQLLPVTAAERTAVQAADLDRRLKVQERGEPGVQVGAGPPTGTPRDGTLYVDQAGVLLYVRVNGAWRYVTLT